VYGQTSVDGAISGVVVDGSGAAVVGAIVRAQDLLAGFDARITTGRAGEFLVARVPAGEYLVTVEATGFETLTVRRLVVELGAATEVEARLRVATVSTAVTVTEAPDHPATAKSEDSDGAAVGKVVTAGEIERLPVNGRRWQTFALMTPGANSADEGGGLLSFRGLAPTQNNTGIDGVDDDQSFGAVPRGTGSESDPEADDQSRSTATPGAGRVGTEGGGGYGRHMGASYTFSQEAVREFRVSGQNYSALYGHGVGGVIATVSKSGTNNVHGTGFYLLRESALGATNPFSIATNYVDGVVSHADVKPHDLRQQFGGTVGGPLVRDRLFYFYAYDQQRRGFPAISTPGDPDFYTLTATQLALLGNRGVTRARVKGALDYLNGLTGIVARRADQTVNFGKMDWQAMDRNHLILEYDRARSNAPGGLRSAPAVDRGRASLGSTGTRIDALLGRWIWQARADVSNEVRLQYGRDFQFEQAQAPLPQEPAVGPGGYAPEVAIGPQGLIFGTPASLGLRAYPDEHKLQVVDLATWVRGRQLIRVGLDFSEVHDFIGSLNNSVGTFSYDSGLTGGHAGGLVDWITDYTFNVNAYPNGGCPSITSPVHDFCFHSFTQSFGEETVAFNTQEWAVFVQDDWRVRQGLTINAGVRYEYELLPLPQKPNAALDAVFGQSGASSVFPEDRNNFGPRVGVAWEPLGSGRGLVRLGYGLYFGRLPGATVRSALVDTAMASSTTHVRIVPGTVTNCPQVQNQGFGYACAYLTTPPAAVEATTSAAVFDRRFRLPTVQQGSLSIERELGGGVLGSATYLMNLDRQLPNSVDINIVGASGTRVFQIQGGTGVAGVRDGERFVVPVYTQRVSTSFGPVTDIVSNANATHHALVLEARRRSRRGLEFRASWTWSKTLDYGQSGGAIPRTNGQFDPFTVQYDRGLSALNYSHKVVASAVWEPRVESERSWLRIAANGWLVAPIFTEVSGRPYSFDIFGGTRLSGGHESINGSGGAVYLPTVGRNTLRLPDTTNLDLRVSREMRVTERVQMVALAEAFNLTNRVNYSAVTQRAFLVGTESGGVTPLVFQDAATVAAEGLNVRPFGSYTASATELSQERQVQLGLRVAF
jgi:hypothetical protein